MSLMDQTSYGLLDVRPFKLIAWGRPNRCGRLAFRIRKARPQGMPHNLIVPDAAVGPNGVHVPSLSSSQTWYIINTNFYLSTIERGAEGRRVHKAAGGSGALHVLGAPGLIGPGGRRGRSQTDRWGKVGESH